ncbi:MAG: tetratricopeptide repeat protein, partial [Burkholderiales bacterium]
WFANILADLGKADAAEKYYERARMLSPGSQPIAVEHACAQWQAGRDQLALKLMNDLKKRYPQDATISNCLAWVHIGLGDIRSFAAEYGAMARIRNEPDVLRLSQAVDKAVHSDPATAHRAMIADARREIAAGTRRIREVPAFYASSMGDRAELLSLMQEAANLGERWYSPSITSRMAVRWKGDTEIMGLLQRLHVDLPKIEGI